MTELDDTLAALKALRGVEHIDVGLEGSGRAVIFSRGGHSMLVTPLTPDLHDTGITLQFFVRGEPSTNLAEFVLGDVD